VRFDRCEFTFLESGGNPQSGKPIHLEPYYLDRYEVSNRQYKEFLAAHPEMPRPKYWAYGYEDAYDDNPVVGISWHEMEAYAVWRGKRLPTLAEWERAAAGLERRRFPYVSNVPDDHRGNVHVTTRKEGIPDPDIWRYHLGAVKAVDSSPEAVSPEGIYNVYGNVEEMLETIPVTDAGGFLVPRELDRWNMGGAYDARDKGRLIAVMCFTGIGRDDASELVGFRCAKSAD
jgi:formylglycine-generating enzyme required for sulfatase activity